MADNEPITTQLIVDTIKQKTTKDHILKFLYYHWQVVLIIGLCVGVLILHKNNVEMNQKLDNLQSLQGVAKTVEALDAKLNSIKLRDSDLYPKLEEKIADLEQARLQFVEAEAKLKQPKIGDIQNGNKNINELEISHRLNDFGFTTFVK